MRTFVKMILPVAAFMLAGAGAIGTNMVTDKAAPKVIMTGYLHTPSDPCKDVTVDCQIVNTGQICQSAGQPVYRLTGGENDCTAFLWKPVN